MRKLHPAGFFEAICLDTVDELGAAHHDADAPKHSKYRIEMSDKSGELVNMHDPYAVPSILTDYDRYLLGEGNHYRMYERLGAHCAASTKPRA